MGYGFFNEGRKRSSTDFFQRKKDKTFYRGQLKKLFISILIVAVIITIKRLNINITRDAFNMIKETVSYNWDIRKIGNIKEVPNKIVSVFNEKEIKMIKDDEYIWPVSGDLYKDYGKIKKGESIVVFNKGLDIMPRSKDVLSINSGIVLNFGNDNLHGKYVKIKHNECEAIYYGFENIYVEKGENVVKGQKIGELKETGKQIGKFHFRILENGELIDPKKVLN
ncbi:M23 family metallopeptidase [Clostridiisalibacter paucivorans]|uniref:M23 family metallopeptidase n=1 Tax=Clostridiisalibacter paucivorans TaxID=408753 RepID=UPI00047B31A5|nr:M23 family metallopeptidase [Clostridiisalibacter paucivorans]